MIAASSFGQVITFYSYKGGTGRSMVLANVAWILASQGYRVLTIDWDLEAPGLHRYFYPFLLDKDLTSTDGLIDFVSNFAVEALTPSKSGKEPSRDWYLQHADLHKYATTLRNWEFPGHGRLDFISAGRQGPVYSTRVNSFDWQAFYNRLGGGVLLDAARERMREKYDYVLIDSRTGVSDTSGITTVQMPDVLVVCFTLNNQGIEGAAAVASSIIAQRGSAGRNGRNLRVFPVAMRVDSFEKKKLDLRKAYARSRFESFPDHLAPEERERFRGEVQIPYVPYYAYEEILATFGDRPGELNTLLESAVRLTAYLTDNRVKAFEPPPPELRERVLEDYERRPNQPDETDLFLLCASPDESWAAQLAVRLEREPWRSRRLKVFFEGRDIRPGQAIETRRQEALANSRSIAVVLSPAALKSEYFQKQIQELQATRTSADSLRLIPLRLDQCEIPPSLSPFAHIDFPRQLLSRDRVQSAAENLGQSPEQLTSEARVALRTLLAVVKGEPLPYVSAPHDPVLSEEPTPLRPTFKPQPPTDEAEKILLGQSASAKDLLELAKRLKNGKALWLARKILNRALADAALSSQPELRRKLQHELVLCTYKDPDLPLDSRLDDALALLGQTDNLAETRDQESLGLAGAIHKRKWEYDGQVQHLETSLGYYYRGYLVGPETDFGYTGINAAYILDLLAGLEAVNAQQAYALSQTSKARRDEARKIRQILANKLPALLEKLENRWLNEQWWFLVTLGEAHFGLGAYDEARTWLKRAIALPAVPAWEYETTARQLANLARLQEKARTENDGDSLHAAQRVVAELFGGNEDGARTALLGKVGLALSGGGFRASLFHIGVLARLAELDVLRQVEVLSCVSGGSVIGAHYYLEVRQLLQSKPEAEIQREDYVRIVERVAQDFLAGVRRNLRTRVAATWTASLKMLFLPNYSRTQRLGELFEQELFSRVKDGEGNQRWLTELFIKPKGEARDFAPKYENWRRRAKVPILVLNATALNTGHNWQFTASWMGEPPGRINSEVDGNERLRRLYYKAAPPPHNKVRLGQAVAASACVPGLFDPINLKRLYPDRIVRLVDGGVHDNQGTASLLEQDCSILLVSDASGQMSPEPYPSNSLLGVPLRSNSILMARLRESEFTELRARQRSFLLRGLMFLHLKQDLPPPGVDWISCPPYNESSPPSTEPNTSYGIAKEMQQAVANLRTDLDSFTDAEAFALMTSGYRMTQQRLEACVPELALTAVNAHPWRFLAIEPAMTKTPQNQEAYQRLLRLLLVGRQRAFKSWLLRPIQTFATGLVVVGMVGFALHMLLPWAPLSRFLGSVSTLWEFYRGIVFGSLVGLIWLAVFIAVVFAAVGPRRLRDWLTKTLVGLGLSVFGSPLAWLHLAFFERQFLKAGSLAAVFGPDRGMADTIEQTSRRIFISSTFEDLRAYREKVCEVLRRQKHILLGLQDYAASSNQPLEAALRDVEKCEIFVSIIAWSYGYIPEQGNPDGKSLVELEYRHARAKGKDRLIFLLDEDAPWPVSLLEKGPAGERLQQFREELRAQEIINTFVAEDDLERKVNESVARWITEKTRRVLHPSAQ